jgi:hypothetical protein
MICNQLATTSPKQCAASFSPNNNNNSNELPRYQARHATCGFVRHFRVRQPCQGDPSAQPHDRLVANPIFVVQGGATSSAGMSTYPDRGRIRAPATFETSLDAVLDGGFYCIRTYRFAIKIHKCQRLSTVWVRQQEGLVLFKPSRHPRYKVPSCRQHIIVWVFLRSSCPQRSVLNFFFLFRFPERPVQFTWTSFGCSDDRHIIVPQVPLGTRRGVVTKGVANFRDAKQGLVAPRNGVCNGQRLWVALLPQSCHYILVTFL